MATTTAERTDAGAARTITPPKTRNGFLARYGGVVYGTAGLLGFLVVWWQVVDRNLVSYRYLSTPQDTFKAFVDGLRDGTIPADAVPSIQRALIGFLIALVAGTVLGILVGSFPFFGRLAEPVLLFFRNLSLLALLPVFVAFLGIGEASKVAIVIWACFWPIFINATAAVSGVERILVNAAKTLGAGRFYIFTQVTLPAAVPGFFPGLRLAAANAFTALVAAELIGGAQGLGIYINNASYRFQTPQIYAGILTLGLLGITINVALTGVERRLTRWQKGLTTR